jgi:hypothetical protein
MLLFPDPSGNTRAVVGSSAGYAARYAVSGAETPSDRDHDGVPDTSDTACPDNYNPNGAASACTTYDLKLTTATATNTLTSKFWYLGHRNCKTVGGNQWFYTNNRCGAPPGSDAGVPKPLAENFDFGLGNTGATSHAKVTWAGVSAGSGSVRVAITDVTVPSGNLPRKACGDFSDSCNSSGSTCGGNQLKLGFRYIHFRSLTLRTDDSTLGYAGVSPRFSDTDGIPSADNGTLFAGPWYIDAIIEIRHQEPYSPSCGDVTTTFSEFRSGALTVNPKDSKWSGNCDATVTGICATYYVGTDSKHKLDIFINLPDVVIDARTCTYNSDLGGVWMDVGLSDLSGQLHFSD